jgi:glycogen debranching enzyme
MAASLDNQELSRKLTLQAQDLQRNFEHHFWDETLGSFVLALDAAKKACRVMTSNAGHCLWAGIASPERAGRVVKTMLSEHLFCGWGIRTLGWNEVRYNPMSYHNGSVWPHDNALVAAGFARYGYRREACTVLLGLLEASDFMEWNRLPELFCGFHKRSGVEGPTLYPVACSPQAWSAGAACLLVSSFLGIDFAGGENTIRFSAPHLPAFIERLTLTGVQAGSALVDLLVHRVSDRVVVEVLKASDKINIYVDD